MTLIHSRKAKRVAWAAAGGVVAAMLAAPPALADTGTDEASTAERVAEGQQELASYFFAYFNGEGGPEGESVRFALSEGSDALQWGDLNDGEAVLRSTEGTLGVRDPFIIRSHDGSTFYLLATDLNTDGVDFGEAQRTGSRHLEIWESTDLVNWSEQRHVEVSTEFAGNTWAPEAFWDENTGQYVVFWASNLYDTAEHEGRDQRDNYNRMMYATTQDFVEFSEPQVWIDSERREGGFGTIDSSVLQEGDTFYRFTKDEGTMTIYLEKSNDLLATVDHEGIGEPFTATDVAGEWSLITRDIGVGQEYTNPTGSTSVFTQGEGPTAFPSLTDPEQWYLFIDQPSYHGGAGYAAMTTTDHGETWDVLDSSGLPASPRHGTVMPVTREENDVLLAEYQPERLVTGVEEISISERHADDVVLPDEVTATIDGEAVSVGVTWEEYSLDGVGKRDEVTVLGWLDNGSATPAIATIALDGKPGKNPGKPGKKPDHPVHDEHPGNPDRPRG
ncbi:glycoside hydrolase family 43 protein [Microbacterium sp. G2-8]|uniref:glycoside hydrolase family 43 protein n=1 Tax=Microbacterium sp. G2-8 TaxID=2842454 RepID=UPI001C8A5963|nr:glycoside hydrolase family 43 protein [Microbacterium sp. G2-8]